MAWEMHPSSMVAQQQEQEPLQHTTSQEQSQPAHQRTRPNRPQVSKPQHYSHPQQTKRLPGLTATTGPTPPQPTPAVLTPPHRYCQRQLSALEAPHRASTLVPASAVASSAQLSSAPERLPDLSVQLHCQLSGCGPLSRVRLPAALEQPRQAAAQVAGDGQPAVLAANS